MAALTSRSCSSSSMRAAISRFAFLEYLLASATDLVDRLDRDVDQFRKAGSDWHRCSRSASENECQCVGFATSLLQGVHLFQKARDLLLEDFASSFRKLLEPLVHGLRIGFGVTATRSACEERSFLTLKQFVHLPVLGIEESLDGGEEPKQRNNPGADFPKRTARTSMRLIGRFLRNFVDENIRKELAKEGLCPVSSFVLKRLVHRLRICPYHTDNRSEMWVPSKAKDGQSMTPLYASITNNLGRPRV